MNFKKSLTLRRTKTFLLIGCVLTQLISTTQGDIVSRYSTDFVGGTSVGSPADFNTLSSGWAYFWNAPTGWFPGGSAGNGSTGAIGTPAHYLPLLWGGNNFEWTADGDEINANNTPSGFLKIRGTGSGHPAVGSTQNTGGNTLDRYVIVAYEIQPEDGTGIYQLSNSSITASNNSSTPLRIYIHIDDGPAIFNQSIPKNGNVQSFDTFLGSLSPGNRIYVAVGPDTNAGSDGFSQFDFSIEQLDITPPSPPSPEGLLINPSAEVNAGYSGFPVAGAFVPGWEGTANNVQIVQYSTYAENGDWRFSIEDSETLYQLTDHTITAGQAFSLRFISSTFHSSLSSVTAALFVDDGNGGRQIINSRTFSYSPANVNDWQPFQLLTDFGELDAHAGKKIGVQFSGPGNSAIRFLSVDGIELEAFNAPSAITTFNMSWDNVRNRRWSGSNFWANRLQDWRVNSGRLECTKASTSSPMRTVHLLTHTPNQEPSDLTFSVTTGKLAGGSNNTSLSGFLFGAGAGMDYRSAALVHHNHGKNGGFYAGVDGRGRAVFRSNTQANYTILANGTDPGSLPSSVDLQLTATFDGTSYDLNLKVFNASTSALISEANLNNLAPHFLIGNIGLVSHPGTSSAARFWFNDWSVSGSKLSTDNTRAFGPIISAMHTLSNGVLTLNAQLTPTATSEATTADLQTDTGSGWQTVATTTLDSVAHTATFRIHNWDGSVATPYRVKLDLLGIDNTTTSHYWQGTIRPDPVGKNEIIVAGMNCMINTTQINAGFRGVDTSAPTFWTKEMVIFPHADLATRLQQQQPDVLFFAGDQLYEGGSPTKADNSSNTNRELDYLYKWYLWCWTFRDLTKDIPTVCIPDDHDVFQGNLWGEGGKSTSDQNTGGYTKPAQFVNMVQTTQTGNLPPAYDPTPVLQNIGVYYTGMQYGRIGFSILEDRKFKTGPKNHPGLPDGSGTDPTFDTSTLDIPGLTLLGDRQLTFLENWVEDWQGQDMKLVLSQTPFTRTTTHSSESMTRKYFDTDTNAWPQTPRNNALKIIRKAFAPHLSGDQHLSSVSHLGIDSHGDANYSFCLPAVCNAFPRIFDPANTGAGPTSTISPYLGNYDDGLGHPIAVKAVGNPAIYYTGVSTHKAPLSLHDRGAGYGIVRFNKSERTITFENWPRYADPFDPTTGTQYPGWPITISQSDNFGQTPWGHLPIVTSSLSNPVIRVIDESNDETVYMLRIKGNTFRPHVFADGSYTVEITEPDTAATPQLLTAQTPISNPTHSIHSFQTSALNIIEGAQVTLSWNVEGSDGLILDPNIGDIELHSVNGIGSITFSPTTDTTYTLTSTQGASILQSQLTVRVFETLETWRARYFGSAVNDPAQEATLWGNQANPDNDTLVNILEYALAADPLSDSTALLPEISILEYDINNVTDEYLTITFRELLEVSNVHYQLEISTDLSTWLPATETTLLEISRQTTSSSHTDLITARDSQSISQYAAESTKLFFRFSLKTGPE